MKVLYIISNDFYSRPNPSYHLMVSMIEDMLSSGIEVCLIGQAHKGLDKHIPDQFLNNPLFSFDLVPTVPVAKGALIKRYLNEIAYGFKIRKYIKRNIKDCDLVFVRSTVGVVYNILSVKLYSKFRKIVYNIQDMFPGSTIASGKMHNRIMQIFFYQLQKIAYKYSDIITVISEDMKLKLIEQGVDESKIRVIVNWFDDKSVKEIPDTENLFMKKYNMSRKKFYVQYAGTMGYVFDYKMVLNVAERLKEKRDIVFQMIGAGSQKDDFIKEARLRGLDNIAFLPLEPQEMVPHVYSACSICFIPLKKGIIGNSVPSKAGLLMACRRAIVTTADEGSDYNKMINDNFIGIACSTDDVEGAAQAILKMKDDSMYRESCATAGYNYGAVLYSRTENTKKYIDLFKSLL